MIEIIRDEKETGTKENGLPKEIRQIGNADVGDRIYLEEKVYQYLHQQTGWDEPVFGEERKVFVLLGKIENYAGQKCVFVEYAIEIEEITYLDGVPVWNDKTWGYVFQKMKKLSEEMIVIGWAMDIKDSAPSLTDRLIGVHITHFGGKHQLLFLLDSMEKEENFYCNRQGRLRRREGFYLYHDRRALAMIKEEMPKAEVTIEHATVENDLERIFWEKENPKRVEHAIKENDADEREEQKTGKFRAQMQQAEEKESHFRFSPTYLLAAIALVLIVVAYQNNSQMKKMSETISQMNVAQTMFGDTEETEEKIQSSEVEVEQLNSNIEKNTQEQTEAQSTDAIWQSTGTETQQADSAQQTASATAQMTEPAQQTTSTEAQPAESEQPATQTMTEAQTYLNQGYYIVQKGDNLEGICLKIYQTTAMMDKICEANGIEDSDAIYEGQYLTLPK
ncbi:MAG: LysM peptidoglycan-binding domain-containing protein [Roseburia sp.]